MSFYEQLKAGALAGNGSGFTPTDAQKNAMDSGITFEKVEQYDAYINHGKNLLLNSLTSGFESRNVTATVATDKTVTLSGTANSSSPDASFTLMDTTEIPAGTYHGSGCPAGGATAKYRIDFVVNGSTAYRDTGNGVDFTINSGDTVKAQIVIYRGNTAPSATWHPMICEKWRYDISPDYVPHS